jgi:dihydroflavonol-4-reductase
MEAVVIGAGGHIGNAIVRALHDGKWQVTACGRRKTPPTNVAELDVRYVPGDADTPGQLDSWIAGHDLVVDAAAPYPLVFSLVSEIGRDPIAHAERRTRWLLEAVTRHHARLAYISSFVTLARPRTMAQQLEAQMMRLAHPYFRVKELIESQILDAGRQATRAVIVNPTYCLGPWDLHDRQLCAIPLLLCGEVPSTLNQMLNVIDVRDVADGLLAALDVDRYDEAILLGGHAISAQDLYSLICEIGGVPPPDFSTPPGLTVVGAYAGAYWMEQLLEVFGRKMPIPSGTIIGARAFDWLASDGELAHLGIKPRPLSETIADAIRWYREIGYC